jgi:hypothetical protein
MRLAAGAAILSAAMLGAACGQSSNSESAVGDRAAQPESVPPPSLQMGGAKSVTRFFVTSRGLGQGGDLGGLAGADAHCQALAKAEGSGDHTWRAYLSTAATPASPAVNARDRIGNGPWYNSGGTLIAATLDELHGPNNPIGKETAVTERLDEVNGVDDTPNEHDILTGSRPDGTAFEGAGGLTCGNWTSSAAGAAQVGHHDRKGLTSGVNSWNSAHASRGCSQQDLESTGGSGRFYCFAID